MTHDEDLTKLPYRTKEKAKTEVQVRDKFHFFLKKKLIPVSY